MQDEIGLPKIKILENIRQTLGDKQREKGWSDTTYKYTKKYKISDLARNLNSVVPKC